MVALMGIYRSWIVVEKLCELWRYPSTFEENTPEPGTLPLLHPQLHHGRPTAALFLRRLGYRLHVRMLLQRLPQRFAEDAHAAAVDHAHPRQAGKKCAVDKLLHFA